MRGDYFCDLINKNFSHLDKGRGVEVGVKKGETSANILRQCPNVHLFMIDPWESLDDYGRWTNERQQKHKEEAFERTEFACDRRSIMQGTSQRWHVHFFQKNEIDMVILDGDHSFGHVLQDLKWWNWALHNVRGIMSGRFYNKIDGVTQAVDEFIDGTGVELHTEEEKYDHGWWFKPGDECERSGK